MPTSAKSRRRVGTPTLARRRRKIANAEVARVLREIADHLELSNANPFRVRAYRNAARSVEEHPEPLDEVIRRDPNALDELPGIGEDLAGKIREIVRTGALPLLRQLKRRSPHGASELMHIRGIGPKRARLLVERLRVHSVADLERAARAGRVRKVPGFGATVEQAILREIAGRRLEGNRTIRATAMQYAESVLAYVRKSPDATRVELAGSARRASETVGDLDVLAVAAGGGSGGARVIQHFVAYPDVEVVLERGATRASVRLASGMQVDLRVVPERSFGAAWHYFTGSKTHNIAVRRLAQKRGLKLNEYGLFRGNRWVSGREEKDVFAAVGLDWVPPEIRENAGEIEAAAAHRVPALVVLDEIRGDLQAHTTDSDGRDTLDAMATAAEGLGYEYVAITDHSPAVRVAGGLDATGFVRQWRRIDRLNGRLKHLTLLRGVECDIHADGTLDLDDWTLGGFDIVLASVHSHFDLPLTAQTARLLAAIRHPAVHVIAHPTARLIGRRQKLELDVDAIVSAAKAEGVALEIDAQPERMDLDHEFARRAIDSGVHLSIGSDAHSTAELGFMRWGVDQARRSWATRHDVLNTRTLAQLLKLLA